ncbi:hypothetical protein FACS189468_0960 [Spirochaetia bacterium]|nr:hypothetical protein FACS189468_0960 [Spirochaetia bacterium]
MKHFIVLCVSIMLVMLIGSVMLTKDLFLGPMASIEVTPVPEQAAVSAEETTAAAVPAAGFTIEEAAVTMPVVGSEVIENIKKRSDKL